MGQDPGLWWLPDAIRLTGEGRSLREVEEILKKSARTGEKAPGKSTIDRWVRDPLAGKPGQAPPTPKPVRTVVEVDSADMTPEEFERWLTHQLRQAQADATACRADGDQPGAGRAMRLAAQLAALLAKVHARTADDGNVVRVTVADMESAASRCRAKLSDYVERVRLGK